MTCKTDTWNGCYDLNWKNLITPAAFSHPAKFSHGLIKRIYDHALADGLIQPGGVVLDPFGGVGLGALYAMQNGLHWVGVELESKFVELGRENINLWNERYSAHFPNWGSAQILAGDSRRLAEVVKGAGMVVSSPPYNQLDTKTGKVDETAWSDGRSRRIGASQRESDGYGQTPGQLATLPPGTPPTAVISSPPFAGNTGGRGEASRNGIDPGLFDRHSGGMKKGTGSDPANLDHLPMGTPPIAIVSSPPYASGEKGHPSLGSVNKDDWGNEGTNIAGRRGLNGDYGKSSGQLAEMPEGQVSAVIASPPFADSVGSDDPDKRKGLFRDEKRRNDTNLTGTYGETPGQLGGMKAGAVISSPPYEGSIINSNSNGIDWEKAGRPDRAKPSPNRISPGVDGGLQYGSTAGQIGATQGQTFWSAARLIVEQCALLLPPNGVAIWVVKNYIKNGAEVDFTGQWQALCEACGFETVHVHRAMLVKENGAQGGMFGADKRNKVERKSFFRRLAEAAKKADAHWETLSNEDRVALIAAAYARLFEDYLDRLREPGKKKKPAAITKTRLMREAKSKAWLRDGRPDYEIETAIDFETILCMRKAA